MQSEYLIEVKDVFFTYPESSRASVAGAQVRLHRGDRVVVIGHNGCGKSTLLSLIGGRRMPQKGTVRVLDADPFDDTTLGEHIAMIGAPWPPEAVFGNTVARVASPAPIVERRDSIAEALHLRLSRFVDKMSAGEKRRVQILHGLLRPSTIFLLDECSTDIDVAERGTVLQLVKKECEERDGCCLYATHILDRITDWATHLLLMEGGRVVDFISVNDIVVPLEDYAYLFMSKRGKRAKETTSEGAGQSGSILRHFKPPIMPAVVPEKVPVIECNGLNFRDVFQEMNFTIYRGERVLLCGCNGSGKSTLLNILGGKQFFDNRRGNLKVLGRVCYDDMLLNGLVAYGGDWWTSLPGGEVHVNEMVDISTERGAALVKLLAVDLAWDVRHISSGEQKRVQLLFHLLEEKPVVLLDEATADLDVDQRHGLLTFLYEESMQRGVTVIYSTHIFGGLSGWPDTVLLLDRTTRGVHALRRSSDGDALCLELLQDEMVQLKAREVF